MTGCSTGLGRALVEHLASLPTLVRIVATARNVSQLSYLADSPNILKIGLDVTGVDSRQVAVSTALAKFKRIDVLVNNAGYSLYGDTESLTDAQMRAQMETNFWGALEMTRLVLPVFRETNVEGEGGIGGTVVQVSSMGGRVGMQGGAMYHASKFALEGATEAMAKEMHPDWKIRFLILEPGGTTTNFISTSMKFGKRHHAYLDEGCPTNQLMKYMGDPAMTTNFARPEKVVQVLTDAVGRDNMPLRLLTGGDAFDVVSGWEKMKAEEMEKWKSVSLSLTSREQSDSIDFLKK